jgi:signal transduction histidine kinase
MGSMKKKLLHKTLRVYILFSLIVLLISAPLFYFLADKLFIDDADEALLLRKKEFFTYNLSSLRVSDIPIWNKFNRDVKIEKTQLKISHDSILYRFYLDTLANNENEPYRVLLSPITIEQTPFVLMARINLVESEDMIKSIALLFCLILCALLIGLYFITRFSSSLWKPFYSTLDRVEQFELDKNVNLQFEENDIEEFTRLNQSVDRLLKRNVVAYKNQKEFIENAAHELQTPLAVFQVKLDSLVQQLPFTDKLGSALSDLNDAAARLTRINKNLLLLSKIENIEYESSDEISINDILKKQIAFLTEQAEEKRVRVQVQQMEPLTVRANLALVEIAISNLLLNALRHNPAGGKIVVSLRQNKLMISNTGHSPLDMQKLFQRFSQPGSARGNGLGLAIVKKISDLHKWTLEYKFQGDMHIFQLVF